MKTKYQKIYEALGSGYGFNGTEEQAVKIISRIMDLPSQKRIDEIAAKYSEPFEAFGVARQSFINGAIYMKSNVES